jgi:hypothetical protein
MHFVDWQFVWSIHRPNCGLLWSLITLAEKCTIWMTANTIEIALPGSIADAAGMERERGDDLA